ncbi:hypothetical protein EVAR_44340_1 [Eumeta japonica]|uniref:Uncharacterized protein n=1 Tax=Eumeta variegata TaxID=151549 RepID=A0A4C1X7L4_EUMVA|nr:hypothetical protein EVAR_44340_1 [Eumeta japonica]
MSVRSRIIRDLIWYGTEDLLLPHARASSRRGYDPDGSSGNGSLSGIRFLKSSPHRLSALYILGGRVLMSSLEMSRPLVDVSWIGAMFRRNL